MEVHSFPILVAQLLHTHFTGDDESVRIWDIETKSALQVLTDVSGRWGQVTCIKWLCISSELGNVLSFGTGRGLLLIYQRSKGVVCVRLVTHINVC